MTTTQLVLISWLAVGLVSVAAIEGTARDARNDGPLSQSSVIGSTIYTLALIVGAPALAVFVLAASVGMLWNGQLPCSDRAWWPARARRADRKTRSDRDRRFPETEILISMVKARKRFDVRLRGENLSKWPMFRFWSSTEAMIFDAVADFCWLSDAGVSEERAVERLQTLDMAKESAGQVVTLRQLIERKLTDIDPAYLALQGDILTKNIALATAWTRDDIAWIKSAAPYPPCEWLSNSVQFADIAPHLAAPGGSVFDALNKREWRRLQARMAENDELRNFCSPPESWRQLAGRKGVALVRNGKPIAYVVTLMN